MIATARTFALATGILISSIFASQAGAAPMVPVGSTGPGWASGARDASSNLSFFMSVQGNQLDNCGSYSIGDKGRTEANDWNDIAHPTGRGSQKLNRAGCKAILYALRTFPNNDSNYYNNNCDGYLKTANSTQYDSYYNSMAEELATYAPSFMIIRVGWELNHKFPWSLVKCNTPAKVEAYKKTHRKVVDKLRAAFAKRGKSFIVAWNFLRESDKLPRPVNDYYPGAAYVDVVSVDYYDRNYSTTLTSATDAKFSTMINRGTVGDPWGLVSWYNYALSLNKPFGIDEWGIINRPGDKTFGGDNPVFIRGMYNFFNSRVGRTVQTSNRGSQPSIAYENYFNSAKHGSDLGTSKSPKATAEYRRLFK